MRRVSKWALVLALLSSVREAQAEELSPTRLSLPDGPGSVEGLGRDFVPSLSSGTVGFSVPITAPVGSGGLTPELTLTYDSGAGDGPLGMGWSIEGLSSVRVRTTEGMPHFDGQDSYEVVGFGPTSRLLETDEGYLRPEFETGSFVRVARSRDGSTWEARDRKGRIHRYGAGHIVEAEGERVVTWLLTETLDLHGHRVVYEWDIDGGRGHLSRIVYNDYGPQSRAVIEFDYEARPDVGIDFSSGIRQLRNRRPTAIRVSVGGQTVRSYLLTYHDALHTRLASIRLRGADDRSTRPPLSFEYTEAGPPELVSITNPPGRSPSESDAALADLDGDSLPDLLIGTAGHYRSYRNVDGRSFESALDWTSSRSPSASLGEQGTTLADFDGDGALDLILRREGSDLRYLPGTIDGFAAEVVVARAPNLNFDAPNVRLADMDGDRRIDFVATTDAGMAIAWNRGGRDFSAAETTGEIDQREDVRLERTGVSLCEVNGDSLLDVCALRSGSLVYWLGRGRGEYEPASIAQNVPEFEPAQPYSLVDVDGDGWLDLARVGVNRVDIAYAVAVGRFDVPRAIYIPARAPDAHRSWIDLNGNGSADLLWVDVRGSAESSWRYLEFSPRGRAGLLRSARDERGASTEFVYEAAALHASRARKGGSPWTTRMNTATSVLARMTTQTDLGDPAEVIEIEYRDGTWSPSEGVFAGFGGASQRDVGDEHTPTAIDRFVFDVGLGNRGLRGSIREETKADQEGAIFSRTEHSFQSVTLGRSRDGVALVYGYEHRKDEWSFEREPQGRLMRTEWEQDELGNVIVERSLGEVTLGDVFAGDDESLIVRTYADDRNEWILGKLATEERSDAAGRRLAARRIHYDGEAFVGLPLGELTRGDLSRDEVWTEGEHYDVTSALAYDSEGRVIEEHLGTEGRRRFEWDPVSHALVIAEHITVSDDRELSLRVELDPLFGTPRSARSYSGAETRYGYDAFGRLAWVAKPGDSESLPTVRYEYIEGSPLTSIRVERRRRSGDRAVDTETLLRDARGRERGRLIRMDEQRSVFVDGTRIDARGHVTKRFWPRFVSAGTDPAQLVREDSDGFESWRDALGREIATRSALGLATRTEHGVGVVRHWNAAQNDPDSSYEHTPEQRFYDARNHLVAVATTLGGTEVVRRFRWDAADRLTDRIDAEGNVTRFTYDGRGRMVSLSDPDAGEHVYAYDARGNVIRHRHPDGIESFETYDRAGRSLTQDWDGNGIDEVVRGWDEALPGQLAWTDDPSGRVELDYDERGRIVTERRTIEGTRFDLGRSYDAQDHIDGYTLPDGSRMDIDLDARGAIERIASVVTVERGADARILRQRFEGGVTSEFEYDRDLRPVGIRTDAPDGRRLQDLSWELDGNSALTTLRDLRPDVSADRNRSSDLRYDNLHRLVAQEDHEGTTSWMWSASGSLESRESNVPALMGNVTSRYESIGPHAPSEFGASSLDWDERGRLIDDGVRHFRWGFDDRIQEVSIADGSRVESVYDSLGERRIRREFGSDGTKTTTYFLDEHCEIRNGAVVRYAVVDGQRVARLDSLDASSATWMPGVSMVFVPTSRRRRRWMLLALALLACEGGADEPTAGLEGSDHILLFDQVGSLTEVVTAAEGTPVSSFEAHAFGQTRRDSTHESRRYAGMVRDASVGIDVQGARIYVPSTQIWASVDPALLEAPGDPSPNAVANPYGYSDLSPLSHVDPDGREGEEKLTSMSTGARTMQVMKGAWQMGIAYFSASGAGSLVAWGMSSTGAAAAGTGIGCLSLTAIALAGTFAVVGAAIAFGVGLHSVYSGLSGDTSSSTAAKEVAALSPYTLASHGYGLLAESATGSSYVGSIVEAATDLTITSMQFDIARIRFNETPTFSRGRSLFLSLDKVQEKISALGLRVYAPSEPSSASPNAGASSGVHH